MNKILVLNYEYPPYGGGAGKVTKNTIENLNKNKYDITVLTLTSQKTIKTSKKGNITFIGLPSGRKYRYRSSSFEKISWILQAKRYLNIHLKTNSYDLILANFTIPGGEVAYDIYKKYKIPYCILSHGHDIPWFAPQEMFLYHLLTYPRIKQILTKSEKLIVLNKDLEKKASKLMPRKKIDIIPNGITKIEENKTIEKNSEFTISFCGRFVYQKNPLCFLKGILLFKQAHPTLSLKVYMMGDGALYKKISRFIKKHKMEQYVILTGWINQEDTIKIMEKSHVYVLSSQYEAFALTRMDAMKANCYVITTPLLPELKIIKKGINGDWFNFNDSKELKKALEKYYQTYFLNNKVIDKKQQYKIIEKYQWNHIANEYDNIFETILENPSS